MKKQMKLMGILCLSGILASTALYSHGIEDNKLLPPLSIAEHTAKKEMRAKMEKSQAQENDEGETENNSAEKKQTIAVKIKHEKEVAGEDQQDSSDEQTKNKEERLTAKANLATLARGIFQPTYYTSHPGAFYTYEGLFSVSFGPYIDINAMRLADGSYWGINPGDYHKTHNWIPGDSVIITPNHWYYFSYASYDFRIVNQDTGESVAVNLCVDPSFYGPLTHWIVGFDDIRGLIYLEDDSVWSMSSFDRNITDRWDFNDTIIIGVNDGMFSSTRPNILINARDGSYAAGVASY